MHRPQIRFVRSQSEPTRDRSSVTKSELEAFTQQARWLMEYHDRRGESLSTRATALMGFSGVILVLLLRTPIPADSRDDVAIQIFGVGTVALLLLTAYFCLRTLLPGSAMAPGVDELRRHWVDWVDGTRRGKALGDIADSYLMAQKLEEDFPLGAAYERADERAGFLRNAAAAMLAALVGLAVLLLLIYDQAM